MSSKGVGIPMVRLPRDRQHLGQKIGLQKWTLNWAKRVVFFSASQWLDLDVQDMVRGTLDGRGAIFSHMDSVS